MQAVHAVTETPAAINAYFALMYPRRESVTNTSTPCTPTATPARLTGTQEQKEALRHRHSDEKVVKLRRQRMHKGNTRPFSVVEKLSPTRVGSYRLAARVFANANGVTSVTPGCRSRVLRNHDTRIRLEEYVVSAWEREDDEYYAVHGWREDSGLAEEYAHLDGPTHPFEPGHAGVFGRHVPRHLGADGVPTEDWGYY